MAENFKLKLSNLRPSHKVTLIVAFIALIGSLIGTFFSTNKAKEANNIARRTSAFVEKEFAIKYTPDIRTYITSWNIYVGEGKPFGRDDNIIVIPMAICNKSYGLAKDIEVKIIYNDGTWKLDKEFVREIPVLKEAETRNFPLFAPSILGGAYNKYMSKDNIFKMKIFITWKNASNEEFEAVELFTLGATEAYSDSPSTFVFVSTGYYSCIYNVEDYKKHSQCKIDF